MQRRRRRLLSTEFESDKELRKKKRLERMATRTARSEKSAKIMKLPNKEQWKRFKDALTKRPRDLKEFADRTSSYLVGRTVNVSGLRGMFEKHEDTTKTFFSKTLLFIDKMALELPNLLNSKHIKYDVVLPSDREIGMDFCPLLESFEAPSKVFLDRRLVLSLLANCFLCSLPSTGRRDMPGNSFLDLFSAGRAPQEIAKLRMFVHYFERAMESIPTGTFEIHRCFVDSSKMTLDKWCKTDTPLGEVALVKLKYGLEETYHEDPSVLQVDFANMYLGGGVLSGGCVQEEIRFSISPELVVGMFFCPVMMDSEAIHLVGSEQFSLYKGYGFSLCYGGDFKDPTARKCDGSVRTALTAIDALDGRCMGRYFPSQWRENNILRELNKAYAGFVRENKSTKEEHYKEIATGTTFFFLYNVTTTTTTTTQVIGVVEHFKVISPSRVYCNGLRCQLRDENVCSTFRSTRTHSQMSFRCFFVKLVRTIQN